MYKVIVLKRFREVSKKLFSNSELEEVEKFILKLRENYKIGKPIGYDFFREKKIKGKRVYYLVYENICIILLVLASNKKLQEDTIDYIKSKLSEFREFAFNVKQEIDNKKK
jgi:putative component of toxin-antitoxin plasmid stabilization module